MYEEENASQRPSGGGFGRAFKSLLLILLIAALAFGLLYLVSERNARRYYLVPEEGNLVVKRGIFFPVGEKPYLPEDPGLAEAYAPVPVPPGETVPEKEAFEEREALNRALFDRLVEWTRPRIESGDPAQLEDGIAYLRRAEQLPVYDPSRREVLESLEAEVAWYEARRLVDGALGDLKDAVEKLARAEASGAAEGEGAALVRRLRAEVASLRQVARALERKEAPPPRPEPEAAEDGAGVSPASEATGADAGVDAAPPVDAGAEDAGAADAGRRAPADAGAARPAPDAGAAAPSPGDAGPTDGGETP